MTYAVLNFSHRFVFATQALDAATLALALAGAEQLLEAGVMRPGKSRQRQRRLPAACNGHCAVFYAACVRRMCC